MKIKIIIAVGLLFNSFQLSVFSQNKSDSLPANNSEKRMGAGIAVSPSVLRFNTKPGGTQVKTIKITNDSERSINFQIIFQDYGIDKDGKTQIAVKSDYRYSFSKFLNVSPSFIELKPHQSKVINVTASIPSNDFGYIAMWTTLIVDQVTERSKLELPDANKSTLALGITAGIGFAIQIYQNPPNVTINTVEILKMEYEKGDVLKNNSNKIKLKIKNTGDGIGYCLNYIELTNLTTGQVNKFRVSQFGVLPGFEKEINFDLPIELIKGKYSALSVIDFGDKETIQTAEIDFKIE